MGIEEQIADAINNKPLEDAIEYLTKLQESKSGIEYQILHDEISVLGELLSARQLYQRGVKEAQAGALLRTQMNNVESELKQVMDEIEQEERGK